MKCSTFQVQNAPKVAEATIDPFDTTMDALECETPYPDDNGIFRKPPFDAEVLYARRATESGRPADISRIETMFNLSIIAILCRKRVNGYLSAVCLCSDSSEITCDLSTESARTLESSTDPTWKVRHSRVRFGDRVRNFGFREQAVEFKNKLAPELKPVIIDMDTGEILDEEGITKWNQRANGNGADAVLERTGSAFGEPCDSINRSGCTPSAAEGQQSAGTANGDIMGGLVAKYHPTSLAASDQVDEADVHCAICARKLTNPESRRVQVGPICREKVGMRGAAHLRGDIVSEKLITASKLYNDPKSRAWILQGCLQLDAPVPVIVIPQRNTEYWSRKRNPVLYYLSKDNKVHCLYKVGKELKHKRITASCRDSELDQMAWKEAKEYIGNGGKKLRTILL